MSSWLSACVVAYLIAFVNAQDDSGKQDECYVATGWSYASSASASASASSSGGATGMAWVSSICIQAKTPDRCIRAHPDCAWCAQQDFSASRCNAEQILSESECEDVQMVQSYTSKKKASAVQRFSHKFATARIRVGDTVNVSFSITEPKVYPVDFYYLMDVSYSMLDDLANIQSLGSLLVRTLQNLTKGGEGSVQIGFGKFVDKVQSPMTQMTPYKLQHPYSNNTEPPFLYKNVVKLTTDISKFESLLRKEKVSGNLDPPEGALDAMLQVVECGNDIGWRPKALRLLMIATESAFHYAGDGSGFLAGISKANDGACHIDSSGKYIGAEDQDYPTINQVVRSIENKYITPIFAVSSLYRDLYQKVSEQYFPGSTWGVLEKDSSNVVDLVTKAYLQITGKQELITDNPAQSAICPWYTASVAGRDLETLSMSGARVDGLESGSSVNYNLHMAAHRESCPDDLECNLGDMKIKTRLYDDVLRIETTLVGAFDCAANVEVNSPICFNHGNFSCGICTCEVNWTGPKCNILDVVAAGCYRLEDVKECSGRGTCVNNRCQCHPGYRHNKERIFGNFCECDECPKSAGLICSGHGRANIEGCSCSCQCDPGWIGKDCNCRSGKENCLTARGVECSGRGVCQCGACVCDKGSGYGGPICSTCLDNCPTCDKFQDCVQCVVHKTGPKKTTCEECDNTIFIADPETIDQESSAESGHTMCVALDATDNCKFYYKYGISSDGTAEIHAEREKRCKPSYSLLIVLWCFLLVLLIGLILLCCWRCCVYVIDKEEEKNYRLSSLARFTAPAMVPLLPAMGAGSVIEFIKAKYLMRRSAKVAVIPVRRTFFAGKTTIKWKTYAGCAADDDFEVLSGGEEGTLARKQQQHQNIQRVNIGEAVVEMETLGASYGGNGAAVSGINREGGNEHRKKSHNLTTVDETMPLLESYDWGCGELTFADEDEFSSIEIPLVHDFAGREIMFWVELYGQEKGVALGLKRTKVIVIKDEDAGILGFPKPSYVFKENDQMAIIPVHRTIGMDGEISVTWFTRDITAMNQHHYYGGRGVLNFKDGEVTKHIEVELIPDIIYDDTEKAFNIQLEDPKGGATLDLAHCMVTVLCDEECALLQFPKDAYPFMENCGTAQIPIIRTRSTKGTCSVKWRTEDITAIAGKDYEASQGVVTFANSMTEAHIEIPIIDNDVFDEAGRSFRVILFDPSESTKLAQQEATISIIEDDEPGMFEFAKTSIVLRNTSMAPLTGHLPLIRSLGTDGYISVPWEVKMDENHIFSLGAMRGAVEFSHGEITRSLNLDLANVPRGDMITFDVVLLKPSGGAKLGVKRFATVTVFGEEDTGSVSFAHPHFQTVATCGMATLLVSRKGNLDNAAFVMCETSDKTATSGTHYRGGTNSVVFEANEAAKEIGIPVYNDPNHKGQLVFNVTLKSAPGGPRIGEIGSADVAITCVAIAPVVHAGAAPPGACAVEFIKSKYLARKSAKIVTIPVHRSSTTGTCVVEWGFMPISGGRSKKRFSRRESSSSSSSSDGEAGYLQPCGSISIVDGSDHEEIHLNMEDFEIESQQMSLSVLLMNVWWDDGREEEIRFGLKQAEVVVLNDVDPGTLGFPKATFSFNAADGVVSLPVHRLGGMDGDVSVQWYTRDGTAFAAQDYIRDSGNLTFANNQIMEGIEVKLLPGLFGENEKEKQFTVELGETSGGAKIGTRTATIRIIGGEDRCYVQFSKASYPVIGNSTSIRIPVLRTGDSQSKAVVEWYTEDGTAKQGLDYEACREFLTFDVDSTRQEIEIPLSGVTAEPKAFKLFLAVARNDQGGTGNVVLGNNKEATVAIISNREPGTFEFSKSSYVFKTTSGSGLVPVVRSNGTDGEVNLPWKIESRDKANLSPFAGAEGFLHFDDGQISASVEVGLLGVPSNSFILILLSPSNGGRLGATTNATVTIIGETEEPTIQIDPPTLSVMTNEVIKVNVVRCGNIEETTCVGWKTVDGTAQNGKHFIGGTGNLVLNPGEESKEIIIPVLCPPTEGVAVFSVALTDVRGLGKIGDVKSSDITMEPMPSKYMDVLHQSAMPETFVEFLRKRHHFQQSQGTVHVPVHRSDTRGLLTIRWDTTPLSEKRAKKMYGTIDKRASEISSSSEEDDYVEKLDEVDWGSGSITFEDGERETAIELILYRELVNKETNFSMHLIDPWEKVTFGVNETLITVIKDRDPGCIEFINSVYEYSCSDSELVIPVNRTSGADGTVSVPWFTRDGTAIGGTHYLPDDGNLVFRDGDVLRKIKVPMPRKAAIFTEDEVAFELILGEPTGGAVLGKNVAIILLKNDVVPSLIGFSEPEYSCKQSVGVVTVPVIRNAGTSGKVAVPWRAISAPGKQRSRFEGTNDILIFKENETEKVIELLTPKGLQSSEREQFILQLEQPKSGRAQLGDLNQCYVTLINDISMGTFFLSSSCYSFSQSEVRGSIPVLRENGSEGETSLSWKVKSSSNVSPPSILHNKRGVVEFNPGQNEAKIEINFPRDSEYSEESFVIVLSPPGGRGKLGEPNQADILLRNDIPCSIDFMQPLFETRGDVDTFLLPVIRTGPKGRTVSAQYRFIDGTARDLEHFIGEENSLNFESGEDHKDILIPILNDPQGDRVTFEVELHTIVGPGNFGSNRRATVAIDNLAGPGVFIMASSDLEVNQSSKTAVVTILRTHGRKGQVDLPWFIEEVQATKGARKQSSYDNLEGKLTFADGEGQKQIDIPLKLEPQDDDFTKFDVVLLTPVSGAVATLGDVTNTRVTVSNDIDGGTLEMASNKVEVFGTDKEVSVPVVRTGSTEYVCYVSWEAEDVTAIRGKHYKGGRGNLIFEPGEKNKKIVIPIINDPTGGIAYFNVALGETKGGAKIGEKSRTQVFLDHVKENGEICFVELTSHFKQSDGQLSIPLHRKTGTTGNVVVPWTIENSSESSPYFSLCGQETFKDGETQSHIEIAVPAPPQESESEYFRIVLGKPSGGAFLTSDCECEVTVENDVLHGNIAFSDEVYNIKQSQEELTIPIVRSKRLQGRVRVPWKSITPVPLDNYADMSGVEIFEDGEKVTNILLTLSKFPSDNDIDEFQIKLSSPKTPEAKLGEISTCFVRVHNDIQPSLITFSEPLCKVMQSEGKAKISVKRTQRTSGRVIVPWKAIPETPESHYLGAIGETVLEDGDDEGIVELHLPKIAVPELKENITIMLEDPIGAKLADDALCGVTIVNDIGEGIIEMKSHNVTCCSEDGQVTVVVARKLACDFPVSVDWETEDDTAISGLHYNAVKDQLKFRIGETERPIHIPLHNDPTGETRHFKVKLLHVHGRDKIGDVIESRVRITNEATPPNAVTKFEAKLTAPQAFTAKWQKPEEGAPLEGYKVTYWSRPGTSKTIQIRREETEITFDSLEPSTSFQVLVRPYNDVGDGPSSNTLIVDTQQEIRLSYDTPVQCKTSDKLALFNLTRNLTTFDTVLECQLLKETRKKLSRSYDTSSSCSESSSSDTEGDDIVLVKTSELYFEPGQSAITVEFPLDQKMKKTSEIYYLRVHEPGKECKTLANIELQVINNTGVPGHVRTPFCASSNPHECTISWEEPIGGGPVESYLVIAKSEGNPPITAEVPAPNTSVLLENLEPSTDYSITVQPCNKIGSGKASSPGFAKTQNEIKIEFSEKFYSFKMTDKVAVIPIRRHFTHGYSTLKWQTQWAKTTGDDKSSSSSSSSDEEANPNVWSTGSVSFMDGEETAEVKIPLEQASSPPRKVKKRSFFWLHINDANRKKRLGAMRCSLIDDKARITSPQESKLEAIGPNAIRVTWNPLDTIAEEYWISFKRAGSKDDPSRKITTPDTGKMVLGNLESESTYAVVVTAVGERGKQASTEVMSCTTPGNAPGPPNRLVFQVLSPTSLQCSWGEPANPNGIITSYEVMYQPIETNEPPILVKIPDGHYRSLLVEELYENHPYKYNVRAKNKWGYGPFREADMKIEHVGSRPPSAIFLDAYDATYIQQQQEQSSQEEEKGNHAQVITSQMQPSHMSTEVDKSTQTKTRVTRYIHKEGQNEPEVVTEEFEGRLSQEELQEMASTCQRIEVQVVTYNTTQTKTTGNKLASTSKPHTMQGTEPRNYSGYQAGYSSQETSRDFMQNVREFTNVEESGEGDTNITTITKTLRTTTMERKLDSESGVRRVTLPMEGDEK